MSTEARAEILETPEVRSGNTRGGARRGAYGRGREDVGSIELVDETLISTVILMRLALCLSLAALALLYRLRLVVFCEFLFGGSSDEVLVRDISRLGTSILENLF
jgi:hypothetical protein